MHCFFRLQKYQHIENAFSPYAKYIAGELPLPKNNGMIIAYSHTPDWDNTPEINYPAEAPEFKTRKEQTNMINWDHIDGVITNLVYNEEAMRFKTIEEFKDSLTHGGEIVIVWNGVTYGIFRDQKDGRFYIGHDTIESNVFYNSPDELLEYHVGGDRLRDVITKVTVIDRFL